MAEFKRTAATLQGHGGHRVVPLSFIRPTTE